MASVYIQTLIPFVVEADRMILFFQDMKKCSVCMMLQALEIHLEQIMQQPMTSEDLF